MEQQPRDLIPRTLLIVDDDEINRGILAHIFAGQYAIREAENGREGLQIIENAGASLFAVLLDVVMPEMDGLAVLRALHFYSECHRAVALRQALEEKDFPGFLRRIIAGGHSSFEYNQNAYSIHNPAEQGVPLALAISQRVLEGRGAWRLQGGGFAGTIQAFVPLDLLESYRTAIDGIFGAGSCHVLTVRNHGAIEVTRDL